MAKYLSGRSKKTPQSKLPADRYKYLSVGDAEPNFGDPVAPGDSVPSGQQYQIVSIEGFPGERYWVPIGGGLIPGSITVFDEKNLVGGINSTTQLNFTGAAITAFGINSPVPGIGVTIKVFAPGNNQEILFNTSNDFSTSSKLKFDSSLGLLSAGDRINVGIGGTVITTTGVGFVGIGTTNPTQELHVQGDLRLTGTIYDYLNRPGNEGEVLVKTNNTFNGLSWTNQSAIKSGAGGTYTNIQYHGSTGLVEGASNFVYDNINNRIGIGSTIPNYLLDVVGYSSFKGQTDIDNLRVGVATIGTLGVTGLTTTRFLNVTGIATIGTLGITGLTTTKDLGVTGVATIGTLGVTGLTTTKDLGVTGVATIGTLGVTGLATTRFLDVTGIATIGTLGVTGLTTTQNLRVSGITTVGFLTGTDAFYTGIVTAQKFDGKIVTLEESIETKTINVTGIGTIATLGVTTFTVSGLTSTKNLNVTGIATILDLTVTGVSTLGNVKISSNKIETKSGSGNLTIDSDGGTTVIKDSVSIEDTTQSTNKDTGALVVDGGVGIEKNLNVGGNVGLGTSSSNTVSFTSRVSSNILPSSGSLNLGSSSNRWGTVFADKFDGAVVGVADTANTVGVGTTTGTGNYFLTFVDSNNPASSRTGEMLYSDAGIVYNPSTNSLGIGTTNPKNTLEVYGDIGIGINYIHRVNLQKTNSYNIGFNSTSLLVWSLQTPTGIKTTLTIGGWDDNNAYIDNRNSGDIYFRSGDSTLSTDNLIIKNGGNVLISGNLGIGTINPGEKLQVDGNMRVGGSNTSNYIAFRGTINDDQVPYRNTYIGERLYKPLEPGGAESSELLLFKGNDVTPSGPDRIRLSAAEIRFDTYSEFYIGNGSFEEIANYGTNRVIITETGNVGIGTITPQSRLGVAGTITPSESGKFDLGTLNLKWDNIYANKFNGTFVGIADSAKQLQTPRNIAITGDLTWNVNFDGSGNVSSGSTLSDTGVTAGTYGSSTQVGIITVDSKGRITAASNVNINFSSASVARAGYADTAGISTTATNLKGGIASQIPYQTAPDTTAFIPNGTSGQLLQSNGTSAPSWVTPSGLNVSRAGYADTAGIATYATNAGISTNLKGGIASQIPYQTAPDTTAFIPNGTPGQLLQSNGTSAPSWVTPSGLSVGSASSITVTSDNTNTTRYIPFVSGTTGVSSIFADNTLTYNPSTDTLQSSSIIVSKGVGDTSGTNSALRLTLPGGASYATTNSVVTGAIKITLPVNAFRCNTMMRMTVKIYEYSGGASGNSRTIELGGYNYYLGDWYNYFAYQTSMNGVSLKNVRFGYEGGNNVIWIGEIGDIWEYPQVYVTEFQGGYSNYDYARWASGWNISFTTAFGVVERGPISSSVSSVTNINVEQINYGCSNPISVKTSSGITTIGIGTTSNAYGRKFIQSTEPTDVCDGDIWYDIGSTNIAKTYTLDAIDSGNNAILRLSDGTTDDDVLITAGSGITIDPVSAGGFTISATATLSNSINGPFTLSTTPFFRNTSTITQDYTVQSKDFNEMTIGPTTINSGVTVTVNVDASWIIL